ncbi:MAG: hypothetical protein ACK55I_39195 [bacterium]
MRRQFPTAAALASSGSRKNSRCRRRHKASPRSSGKRELTPGRLQSRHAAQAAVQFRPDLLAP